MPYPDKLLTDDEEVVRHLHPHGLTVFWPVVRFLLVVGAASFGMAVVPAGPRQGQLRLLVLGVAVLLLLTVVLVPLLRWRSTHYVITSHRLLLREGVLARRGRDLALSRITQVSFRQTLWERIIRSGTISIESAGDAGPTVLRRVPDCDGVQHLLNHMVEEDADRRAQETAGRPGEHPGPRATGPHPTGSWDSGPYDDAGWDGWDTDPGGSAYRSTRHHEHH